MAPHPLLTFFFPLVSSLILSIDSQNSFQLFTLVLLKPGIHLSMSSSQTCSAHNCGWHFESRKTGSARCLIRSTSCRFSKVSFHEPQLVYAQCGWINSVRWYLHSFNSHQLTRCAHADQGELEAHTWDSSSYSRYYFCIDEPSWANLSWLGTPQFGLALRCIPSFTVFLYLLWARQFDSWDPSHSGEMLSSVFFRCSSSDCSTQLVHHTFLFWILFSGQFDPKDTLWHVSSIAAIVSRSFQFSILNP